MQELARRILPLCENYMVVSQFTEARSQFKHGLVNHAFAAALRAILQVDNLQESQSSPEPLAQSQCQRREIDSIVLGMSYSLDCMYHCLCSYWTAACVSNASSGYCLTAEAVLNVDLLLGSYRTIMPWWHNWSINIGWGVSLFRGCGSFVRYFFVSYNAFNCAIELVLIQRERLFVIFYIQTVNESQNRLCYFAANDCSHAGTLHCCTEG